MTRISDLLSSLRARDPGRVSLIQRGAETRVVSFGELAQAAGVIGALLRDEVPSPAVGIFARRSVEHVSTVIGCLHNGIPYFSLNPKAGARQVVEMCRIGRARTLVVDNAAVLRLGRVPQLDLDGITLLHVPEGPWGPAHDAMLQRLSQSTTVRSIEMSDPSTSSGVPAPDTDEARAACFLFTSGSTGRPKCVAIRASDLLERVRSEVDSYGLSSEDRLLNVLPFSFDVGCNQLLTALSCGAPLILLNSWLAQDILAAVREYDVTGMSGVPAVWRILMDGDDAETRAALARLRYLTISGGDLDPGELAKLRSLTPGVGIYKTYGQTETFRSAMLLPDEFEARRTSVGRPPRGVRVAIVDADGAEVGPGVSGQVLHSGVGTMLGYLGDEAATAAKVVQRSTEDGSQHRVVWTGDRGYVDEDGYLFVQGRMDRMIKVRGNRVYPEEVESALRRHPEVVEAVVLLLDAETGAKLIAGVVPLREDFDPGVLRSFLAEHVMAFMIPEVIVPSTSFGRTATGKIDLSAARSAIVEAVEHMLEVADNG